MPYFQTAFKTVRFALPPGGGINECLHFGKIKCGFEVYGGLKLQCCGISALYHFNFNLLLISDNSCLSYCTRFGVQKFVLPNNARTIFVRQKLLQGECLCLHGFRMPEKDAWAASAHPASTTATFPCIGR